MDDPNITMEEYIKLEEKKLIGVDALPCKSQVSTPVNDEIYFRISFDESDDEDYTIICDKISFSYKMISVNNLETDSKNDNEKAGVPYFTPPKPTINFKAQHNNESDLNNEATLSECDEVGQNVLYFNDLFPFNVIHPNDLKSDEDNDNNEIDIIQSSDDMSPLPPHEQRHLFLRVQVVDFQGMPELMRDSLFARMVMKHRDDAGVVVFTSRAWGRLLDTRGPLVWELILEFLSMLRFGEVLLDLDAPGLDVGSVNILYLLSRYVRRFASGRKSGAYISGGQYVARLAEHFGLLTTEILGGLTVIAPELSIIDIGKLVRLQICMEVDDRAWVAMGLERQPDAAAGALRVAQDAPIVDEGGQADPTHV
ncbi:hypothetical protein Tco_1266091 [Tanacetum coccineum]